MAGAVLLYALAGAAAGALTAGLVWALDLGEELVLGWLLGYLPPGPSGERGLGQVFAHPRPWAGLLALPALYLLAASLGAERGLSGLILAHRRGERVRLFPQLRYALASLIELASGSPLGREGPASVLGSWTGHRLGLLARSAEAEAMGHAGMAAGFAAAFHAPLAGALLATEILYSTVRLRADRLTASLVGAFTGFAVYGGVFGYGPLIELRPGSWGASEVWASALLAALVAALVNLWTRLARRLGAVSRRLERRRRHLLLGLLLGAVAYLVPEALGPGFGWLELATTPLIPVWALGVMLAVRYLLTAAFLGLGGFGAPLSPALVLGGLSGVVLAKALPLALDPSALALAGLSAWLAGAARVPLAAVALAVETAGYAALPLVLVASGVGFTLSQPALFPEQE